jgi:16S rRNA (cytosine967-C5)-methyltransferase
MAQDLGMGSRQALSLLPSMPYDTLGRAMASNPNEPSPPLERLLGHAADMLQAARAGRSLTDSLAALPDQVRPGTQAIAFQVMRWLGSAQAARRLLAPRAPPPAVDALLTTALVLLWPTGEAQPYADHTLVDQAVRAANSHSRGAGGFANAVLRRFVRERAALVERVLRDPQARFNHPRWWIERVRNDWPSHWEALLAANQMRPPLMLRANARRLDAQQLVARFAAAGVESVAIDTRAVWVPTPRPVADLPGFAGGDFSVQDLVAQRAAPLLLGADRDALPARARVLDACAAPGGKTTHLLECADLDLLALDADAGRLERVAQSLQRLHLSAELKCADARTPATWWDGRRFDAILIDAPCSGSGVVRRHPDIRWLRRSEDITALARVQGELLDALWPLLAPRGRLLYATCSIFRAEGGGVIDAFLQRAGSGRARLDPGSPGHLLPLPDNLIADPDLRAAAVGDGFFYALLHMC